MAKVNLGYFFPGKIQLKSRDYTMDDEIRANSLLSSYIGRDENRMVNGTVFIMDCTGWTLKHITRGNNDEMKRWHKAVQVPNTHLQYCEGEGRQCTFCEDERVVPVGLHLDFYHNVHCRSIIYSWYKTYSASADILTPTV